MMQDTDFYERIPKSHGYFSLPVMYRSFCKLCSRPMDTIIIYTVSQKKPDPYYVLK